MPYIPKKDRTTYDPMVAELARLLADQPPERRKGHANYVVTQLLRRAWGVDQPAHESYSSYADIVGTLSCVEHELYRRWVAAYEDRAIERYGDL